MKCTPENMQAAAIQLAGKASCDEVGRSLGVSGETIRLWTKRPDWGKYWESAQAIVDARAIKSNIVHLHPILPHGGTNPLVRLESTHKGLDIVGVGKAGPIRRGVGEGDGLAE